MAAEITRLAQVQGDAEWQCLHAVGEVTPLLFTMYGVWVMSGLITDRANQQQLTYQAGCCC